MRFNLGLTALLTSLLAASTGVAGMELDVNDPNSVKLVARELVSEIFRWYTGNTTGIPGRYADHYWWEAGALMGAMIDYWAITGDDGNNPTVMQAMLHQVGHNRDFEPLNVTRELGNDDQGFWALAALGAAERVFPDPPKDQPQWIALAQAVFNRQTTRWEDAYCGGGMRWQVVSLNAGWNYKNTISNGLYFQIGARLARFTGNMTYATLAEKSYDWMVDVGFLSPDFRVFDGGHIEAECKDTVYLQWTYNAAIILAGCANMYDITGDQKWKDRVDGYLKATEVFFTNDVMYEVACERKGSCNADQRSFKAYLSRFLGMTVQLCPWTADYILPKLRTSAVAAARQCDAGEFGKTCGMRWTQPTSDQTFEHGILGQTMSALECVQNTLIESVDPPATAKDRGTSEEDPTAGQSGESYEGLRDLDEDPIRPGEKAAAAILTVLVSGLVGGLAWFVTTDRVN